ncbi:hypothetical protein F3Y22_tig00111057pilonHSYRG00060 [Hibiscus syriacus]|uniref:Uncharacterized protein n=1 Tax=Hibiscus syriacus TaxID=106335 RepID=A0A6A2Z4E3_HIBSY|nr:hypothetical protein F3Y22_tig00111057pilonHSYRG00060 [Hibiscus syriacus]
MASSKELKIKAMGSSNPALERSEKCATPGSVSQKKAYFEEHYKKIAARKAELQAQEKSDEGDPTRKSDGDEGDKQEIYLLSEANDIQETKSRFMEETAPEEEAFLVKKEMETPSKGSQDVVELSSRLENAIESTPEIKDKNLKLGQSAKSHKITAVNKERIDSRMKKKPASPIKNSSVEPSKKVAPRSLHMSLSVDPSSPDPASLPATRKSLFMEKMGDKDIVKRAFKSFQSNYNQLKPSSQEQSAAAKPAPAKGRESRVPTLTTLQKENGGLKKWKRQQKKKWGLNS